MTAVEWLQEKISYTTTNGNIITYHGDMTDVFEQAKQMEKEQIIEAYEDGTYHNTFGNENYESSEEYYHKTFKSE